jgi:hypothetical protein
MKTTLIVLCNIDRCNQWVTVEFDKGYPATRDDPGMPDWWYVYDNKNHSESHTWALAENQSRFDYIANSSWDNDMEYTIEDLQEL